MAVKTGQSTDGDALFSEALMTVCRKDVPRDGGAAINAFLDWLIEWFNDRNSWVALCDHKGTGMVLLVLLVIRAGAGFTVGVTLMSADGDWADSFSTTGPLGKENCAALCTLLNTSWGWG